MNKRSLLIALACLFILLVPAGMAQEKKPSKPAGEENVAQVPALSEFHTVIFKIWHTAWPKKDVAMLSGLVPEIRKRSEVLAKAKLPGILRDKKARWDEGIAKLQEIIGEYAAACSPADTQKLLDAAERLHAQYERLGRTIHPVMPELEEFHVVLYQLYHYDMPSGDLKKIGSSVPALELKMKALEAAVIPERLEARNGKFTSARSALSSSLAEVESALASKDKKVIREKIELMHSDYQALEKVFE